MRSYTVRASDWHDAVGRGRIVLVPAPRERHAIGEVISIHTEGDEGPAQWQVITGREGSVGISMTVLQVRPARPEEIPAPEPDPTTMTEAERIKEASRQAYAILSGLAGCISMDRNAVNELRNEIRRLKATIVGIEYEPDCDHRWDWPDGTTRHGRPPAV
ncbi:MAG: hypothetical protein PGN33_21960 [Methylobacterium radiotolerans]